MTSGEAKAIGAKAEEALNRVRTARTKTADLVALVPTNPSQDALATTLTSVKESHEDALKAAKDFAAAVSQSGVTSIHESVNRAVARIEAARNAALQLAPSPVPDPSATKAADDDAVMQIQDVIAAFHTAREGEQPKSVWQRMAWLRANVGLVSGIGIFLLAAFGFWQLTTTIAGGGPLLDKLAQIEYARGLITFILAIGTILIAVLLVTAALLGGEESKDNFGRAKEVLTVLIGVFGTILGFYYGSDKSAAPLRLGSPTIVRSSDGRSAVISAFVGGGKPPYQYSLSFEPEEAITLSSPVRNKASVDGHIVEIIPIDKIAGTTPVSAIISAADSDRNSVSYRFTGDNLIPIPKVQPGDDTPDDAGKEEASEDKSKG